MAMIAQIATPMAYLCWRRIRCSTPCRHVRCLRLGCAMMVPEDRGEPSRRIGRAKNRSTRRKNVRTIPSWPTAAQTFARLRHDHLLPTRSIPRHRRLPRPTNTTIRRPNPPYPRRLQAAQAAINGTRAMTFRNDELIRHTVAAPARPSRARAVGMAFGGS